MNQQMRPEQYYIPDAVGRICRTSVFTPQLTTSQKKEKDSNKQICSGFLQNFGFELSVRPNYCIGNQFFVCF
jgi:hypothetical protein